MKRGDKMEVIRIIEISAALFLIFGILISGVYYLATLASFAIFAFHAPIWYAVKRKTDGSVVTIEKDD
jgi:hypothetical protein